MVKAVVVLRIRPNPSFTAKLELDLMRIGNSLPHPIQTGTAKNHSTTRVWEGIWL
jgi:hypothetical protein